MLTGGYLSKLVLLATAVGAGHVQYRADLPRIRFLGSDEQEPLLKLAGQVGILENGDPFRLSESGKQIELAYLESRSCALPFRLILSEYIRRISPPWSFRIPAGRMELYAILPMDVANCFHSAGLMNSKPDDEIVNWWSDMATFIRAKIGEQHGETGRNGEILSLNYERVRTGIEPKWVSFESNFAGYDILSVDSSEERIPRRIEVKTSLLAVPNASFFVSENEWNTAMLNLDNYRFHLWSVPQAISLADISAREVEPHIPNNNSSGCWKSAEIPFSVFATRFVPVMPAPTTSGRRVKPRERQH